MLAKRIADLNSEDLQELCNNRTSESVFLEFKSILPDKSDKGKFEFVKDVVAFTNRNGGDIIFGISELNGVANRIVPIKDETFDSSVRRLGQILDAGVEPPIIGVEYKCIELDEGHALVLRVPSSQGSPRRIVFNGNSRFVTRESGYIRDMSYSEIMSEFNRSGNFLDFVRTIRRTSLQNSVNGNLWRPIITGPICILQVIPMNTVLGFQAIDVMDSYENYGNFMLPEWDGLSRAINLDGPVFYVSGSQEAVYGYNQINRNGVIEAYTFSGYSFSDQPIIPALSLALFIRTASERFIKELKRLDIRGSAAICVTLVGVQGKKLEEGGSFFNRSNPVGDRDIMNIPEFITEDISRLEDIDEVVRPILNIIWQAFGITSCRYFNADGHWTNPN